MSNYPDYVKELSEVHPVKVYFDESFLIQEILHEIEITDIEKNFQKFYSLFNQLSLVEKRFARKENQLFPYLEKNGWYGPSQGMWAFQDQIRELFKNARKKIENKELITLKDDIQNITAELRRLLYIESTRLFPNAIELLSTSEWEQMSLGDEEIGWMLENKPKKYFDETEKKSQNNKLINNKNSTENIQSSLNKDSQIYLDEGSMTSVQINLMLKFMPVDLTYVDENDRVVFYNRGENRVFPRSAGVIGREVRFCHPPKSVNTVLRILEEFKAGTKNEAEFWIRFKSRVIHIRYFAIRDQANAYKGVIEMSQDITEIQKLEGEQRLLSWDS